MTDFSDSYISPRVDEVEKEFSAAGRLHSLLERWFSEPRPDMRNRIREISNIPVREGWRMDALDVELSLSDVRTRYGDEPIDPVNISFWPEEDNNVSPEQFYFDGPKLAIIVCKNGVLNQTEQVWLNSSQIEALLNDLSGLKD